MDTSEQYIKMCDCPEIRDMIQKVIETDHKRKVETRRRFVDTKYSVRIPDIRTPDVSVYDEDGSPMRRIDLLSQDQIQAMVREYYAREIKSERPHDKWFPEGSIGLGFVLKKFAAWTTENNLIVDGSKSFEQLWLAFYMWERHKKVWANEKWVA